MRREQDDILPPRQDIVQKALIAQRDELLDPPSRREPGHAEAEQGKAAQAVMALHETPAIGGVDIRKAQFDIPLGETTGGRGEPGKERSHPGAENPNHAAWQPAHHEYTDQDRPGIPVTGVEKSAKGNVSHE
jgi:hypothetical protein